MSDDVSELLELLFAHRDRAAPAGCLGDALEALGWSLDEAAAARLLRLREAWLASDDRARVEIALAMRETFPFLDPREMERVLADVAARWPDLAPRCAELVSERSRLGEH